jgi:hypothetical protein
MAGGDVFRTLLRFLTKSVERFPDRRRGRNTQYSMRDIGLSAFGVFFCQSPSFLSHQALMQQVRGVNNANTLFGVDVLPTDNHIRWLLDAVDPKNLHAVYRGTFEYLQQQGVVEHFRSFGNTLLVALDGTGYFRSEAIHCPQCSVARHADGRVVYTHAALMAAVVKPGMPQVLALEPEFITPQDGHQKQDCESAAARRWIPEVGGRLSGLGLTLLGDDLYACTPIIRDVLGQEVDYIFVAKESSHPYLYEELQSFDQLEGGIEVLETIQGSGAKRRTLTYRFANGVPLTADASTVQVNWVEVVMRDDSGKITFRAAFVTSHWITPENVAALVQAGRCRWKIENEDFNTLKTKGYHFEHNFGHGTKYLAQTLLSLNILAFLFHTVLELLDERCASLRALLPRRDTFFHHLDTLVQYLPFANWQSLLEFMIRARRDGPGPPPESFPIRF